MTKKAIVVFLGKLGHGKTFVCNKVTGTKFPSDMRAKSCTETLQFGTTSSNIVVVDTPGFYASDNVAAHVAAQKLALEGMALSGIYIVVKYARVDDLLETIDKILTYVDDDNPRIIVTHGDVALQQDGANIAELKSELASRLETPSSHIIIVGKHTRKREIDQFLQATLHEPKQFSIGNEQVSMITALCRAKRSFDKRIKVVLAKIAAASKECSDLFKKTGKSYETDLAIAIIQKATFDMAVASKESIFKDAQKLSVNEQNLVYGNVGLSLSIRLQKFMDATNQFLSWDVTDPSDTRNVYKKCNHCGAIFNKTEGCDSWTTCGALPTGETKKQKPELIAAFREVGSVWTILYLWNGREVVVERIHSMLRDFFNKNTMGSRRQFGSHTKKSGASFESGCGAKISWNTMLPVEPELVAQLGVVKLVKPSRLDLDYKRLFDESVKEHEYRNRRVVQKILQEANSS